MTADELAASRKRLGLTQSKLGDKLGHHQVTIAHWESGTRPIPKHVDAFFEEALARLPATPPQSAA